MALIVGLLALAQRLGNWEHKLLARCLGVVCAGLLIAWPFLFLSGSAAWLASGIAFSGVVALITYNVAVLRRSLKAKRLADANDDAGEAPADLPQLSDAELTRQSANYLTRLRDEVGHIKPFGMDTSSPEAREFPISEVYVPLRTTVAEDLDTAARSQPASRSARLETVIKHRRVIIQGDAGSGKSTFVRRVAYELAAPDDKKEPLELPVRGFPLYIRISQLATHIEKLSGDDKKIWDHGPDGSPTVPTLAKWIPHFLAASTDCTRAFFESMLHRGDTVLLLDGLDEVPNEVVRAWMATLFADAARSYPNCHIVVTTRPAPLMGEARPTGFSIFVIDKFGDEAIADFIAKWCLCRYGKKSQRAELQRKLLSDALELPELSDKDTGLARNPFMLAALTVIHFNGGKLPENRLDLYTTILKWLANARLEVPGQPDPRSRLERVQLLAFAMQTATAGRRKDFELQEAVKALSPLLDNATARRYLRMEEDGGILSHRGDTVEFVHLTFQECLAAEHLKNSDAADIWDAIRQDRRLYSREWREVLYFLACMLQDTPTYKLFTAILDGPELMPPDSARKVALVTFLRDQRRKSRKRDSEATVKEANLDLRLTELTRQVTALFDDPDAGKGLDAKTRADAAEAWERLGDLSRLFLPSDGDKYWAKVGKLKIGRFPVTVGEYAKFVKAKPKREPRGWNEQTSWQAQTKFPYRPVVCVTWHDADAYCKWAHKTYGCVRPSLPESDEWQRAAEGEGKPARLYPWGDNDPSDQTANFDNNVGRVTPVGLFPAGNTDKDVSDLAGNVWEWTNSDFDEDTKVLRGGAFSSYAAALRVAYRSWDHPEDRISNIGFRCVGD